MPRYQPHRRQAYYDDVLNITWLADANMRSVDIRDGLMTWSASQTDSSVNTGNHLGVTGWLPTVTDTGAPGCGGPSGPGACRVRTVVTTSFSAVARWPTCSSTLGNTPYYYPSGVQPDAPFA